MLRQIPNEILPPPRKNLVKNSKKHVFSAFIGRKRPVRGLIIIVFFDIRILRQIWGFPKKCWNFFVKCGRVKKKFGNFQKKKCRLKKSPKIAEKMVGTFFRPRHVKIRHLLPHQIFFWVHSENILGGEGGGGVGGVSYPHPTGCQRIPTSFKEPTCRPHVKFLMFRSDEAYEI